MSKNFNYLLQPAELTFGSTPAFANAKSAETQAEHEVATTGERFPLAESIVREESLKLVQRLFLNLGDLGPKAVTFAAIDSGTECSSLCALIAKLLAESISGSVCLVEGNFRAPSLSRVLGLDIHYGLADALRQEGAIKCFAKQVGPDNLWLLAAGSLTKDAPNLISANRMKERVSELRAEFDYLVIDVPPLNVYADALVWARLTDGVVPIVEANRTRREAARQITDALRAAKIPVLGAILNNRTYPIPGALYKRF